MKNGIKRVLRALGFELRRYSIQTSAGAQLDRLVKYLGVDLVLDVGSNVGQYAQELRSHGYRGPIVSFEPSATAHAGLTKAAQGDGGWSVAPRMALGSTGGEATLHVA